jgi:WD40 repeat protein
MCFSLPGVGSGGASGRGHSPMVTIDWKSWGTQHLRESGCMRNWLAHIVLSLLAALPAYTFARAPSTDPILSVETGGHSRIVRALAYDASRDRLVSASLDRTVRIWSLPELRLSSVLRVPMEVQREGELTNVQVSPNGKIIATGGWTGWEWDQQGTVYLFDAETGELLRRLTGFSSIIGDLRFSPDGRWLAVGLHAGAGLVFIDTTDWSIKARDPDYAERVVEVSFAANGLVASTSLDGYLRIYGPDFELLARKALPSSRRLASLSFAPDGTRLAVGFFDAPVLLVLKLPELEVIEKLVVPDAPALLSLTNVSWSRDGRFLFAAGDRRDSEPQAVYRFDRSGEVHTFPAARSRIAHLLSLPGGRIAYATEDPSIGLIDVRGRRLATSESDVLDFRDGQTGFSLSADGTSVELSPPQLPEQHLRFSISELELRTSPGSISARPAPELDAESIGLKDWKDSEHPFLDGIGLPLDRYERSRSIAVSPTGRRFFVGAEWWLRAFSASGRLVARVPTPGPVWRIAVSARGDYVVAALGDGTVRWYRTGDLSEALALFVHGNARDWVLWRPDGYYASSEQGDNYVGWHLNRGKDAVPDYFRAVQFERLFYRPDLLRSSLEAASRADAAGAAVDRDLLARIAPPRVRVLHIDASLRGSVRVAFDAERVGAPMQSATVYLNGVPLSTFGERALSDKERSRFTRVIDILPEQADNVLRIEVDTGVSIGLQEIYLPGPATAVSRKVPGDLYVVAIGVGRLANGSRRRYPDLPFATRDADELVAFLRSQATVAYRNVYVNVLAQDEPPTRRNIERALRQFRSAGRDDTSVLFVSSHGISDARGNYYMLPRDARPQEVRAVVAGKDVSGTSPSLIGWRTLFESLHNAAGKRVLVVDTCHAKDAAGTFDARSLKKRSASSHFPLLLSSDSKELSQDYPKARHGLFTYALLRGLRGEADTNQDGVVSLAELSGFVSQLVTTLQDKRLGVQTPQFVVPEPLRGMLLARVPGTEARSFEVAGISRRHQELDK